MAKRDKLIKSKSIYTIKKQHAVTNNGIIYENDYVTIVPNDGIYDDEMALFSDSNFKYKIDTTKSSKKRHNRGEFIKNKENSEESWTLNTLNNVPTNIEESTIVIKPDYNSLKDFAYYGSATELIKATVNDIILRFPGGISYYGNNAPLVISGETSSYYLVSNEFEIDWWTTGGTIAPETIKNPMRVLAASYLNYVDSKGKPITLPNITITGNCRNTIIGTAEIGLETLEIFLDGNLKKHLVTKNNKKQGVIIKPKQEIINKFWESLDDFERVLLNRDTTPIYKAIFETPFFNNNGYYYQNKSYVWPTVGNDGFTPDITTGAFQGYLESLISLASYHDDVDSDNIWRMLTHESIKNLDWTFNTKKGDDESDFDTKGMGAMLRIYGRQFDDIKRYADNIKNTNTLTYDEKSNIPDYFLSDKLENEGWEAQYSTPFDNETIYKFSLYNNEKTSAYANSAFQRRLSLSSNYIQSMKGTRRGLETILGMFGYKVDNSIKATTKEGFFNIYEYVATTEKGLSYDDACEIRSYGDNIWESYETHLMEGYPVAVIKPGDDKIKPYLVPWFDKNMSNKSFYFQCKGGWGKRTSKEINLPSLTDEKELKGDTIPIYGETQPYMRFAKNINELLNQDKNDLYEGIICYVTDISTIDKDYIIGDEDDKQNPDFSHYFSLRNINLSTHCGFLKNDLYNCYGWKNITNDEIRNLTSNEGKKVIYLESLITNYKGNNPHIGYGNYDDGSKYLEHFTHLFKTTFEMGLYDRWKIDEPNIYNSAATFGFPICEILDNKKCAFFDDLTEKSNLKPFKNTDNIKDWNSNIYKIIKFPDTPTNINNKAADESQANGIINIKKLVINFGIGGNKYLKNYIQSVVLKYLEQMIPSTTILHYKFDNENLIQAEDVNLNRPTVSIKKNVVHAAITDNNENITIWKDNSVKISPIIK